ncbi:mucin-associated surface protein (MASP), putative [Trypanosoma cruzi marinkellei]|uniref:Mucin-associated surface protein (MASP), putative n=1 Tax=Trypanosoma cruzi marinkellei TaxID=85056 RepID=K2MRA2_TRYCR|nr:mucin-associated surface protein (MASP), putative [Trypanosoma cruzi marinkellei]
MVATMMTGRVLLVCALCVLWCGAAVVVSSEPGVGSRENVSRGYLVVNWETLLKNECATNEKYMNKDGTMNQSAVKDCIRDAMNVVCDVFHRKMSVGPDGTEVERICEEYAGNREEAGRSSTLQASQSSHVRTLAEAKSPKTPESESAELGKTPGETPKPPSGAPAIGDALAEPTGGPPTPPVEAQHKREERLPVPHPEDDAGTTESTNNSEEDDSASTTDNQESVASDSHDESTPTLSSAASNTVTNQTGRGDTEGTPKPATDLNAERTEAKENDEKIYDNTKEIPVRAVATTNHTVTPGDSDGSTAVSYTTSPLLLLLVACAAAAAVVAA